MATKKKKAGLASSAAVAAAPASADEQPEIEIAMLTRRIGQYGGPIGTRYTVPLSLAAKFAAKNQAEAVAPEGAAMVADYLAAQADAAQAAAADDGVPEDPAAEGGAPEDGAADDGAPEDPAAEDGPVSVGA